MEVKPFDMDVRHNGGVTILDLHGEIDAAAAGGLTAAYDQAEEAGSQTVMLNFGDVQYMNSTGIALIVSLLARARAAHHRLIAYGLSDHYVEIFSITRLADFMTVSPDESSAMAAARA